MTDEQLLNNWLTLRDADAFNAITTRYAGLVFATAMRILRNTSDAEDVAQSCFEGLATTEHPPTGELAPWLHRVATNRALDHIRTTKNRTKREKLFADDHQTKNELVWNDIYPYIDEAINELPNDLRDVLVERYYANRSAADIAQRLGITPRTVYNRRDAGLKQVRKTLHRRGISVASALLVTLFSANLVQASTVPASLSITLGKLAVAGVVANYTPSAITNVATIGTLLLMKKIAIGSVILIVFALGIWNVMNPPIPKAQPPQSSYAAKPEIEPPSSKVPDATEFSADIDDDSSIQKQVILVGDVTGRFYNSITGEGIPDMRPVIYEISNGKISKSALTVANTDSDENGQYRIANLLPGQYSIEPMEDSKFPITPYYRERLTVTVAVDSVVRNVDFALDPGLKIVGIVRNLDDTPAARATVTARSDKRLSLTITATTSTDGSYALHVPEGDGNFKIHAWKNNMQSPIVKASMNAQGTLDLTLTESLNASISGRVVDAQNRLVENATVGLTGGGLHLGEFSRQVKTDATGQFTIKALAPGEYSIYTAHPGSTFKVMKERLQMIAILSKGELMQGLQLSLGANLSISGHVITPEGATLAGAKINAQNETDENSFNQTWQPHAFATTQDDGTFLLTGLEAGTYKLFGMSPGQRFYRDLTSVSAGTEDVELVMNSTKMNLLQGSVLHSQSGEAITRYKLYTLNDGPYFIDDQMVFSQLPKHIYDPDGRFSLEVPEGITAIGISAEGYAPIIQNIDITDSKDLDEVLFSITPSRYIEGSVVDTNGAPIAGAHLFWGDPLGVFVRNQWLTRTDSQGVFSVNTIPNEARVLTAGYRGYATQQKRIAQDMTFVLEVGGVLYGHLASGSTPIHSAEITLRQGDRNVADLSARSDFDGTYRISGIPAGSYTIRATLPDTIMERALSISAGEKIEENFDLALSGITVYGQIIGIENFDRVHLDLNVFSSNGPQQYRTRGNGDGTYQFNNVAGGSAQLKAQVYRKRMNNLLQLHDLEIPENEDLLHDIHFSTENSAAGVFNGQ